MANKVAELNFLFDETVKSLSSDANEWQNFLKVAGYNYRLRYDEQFLIYAQRPEAVAVLEIEKWNIYFGRWVKRGAKGIAVFDDNTGTRQRLKYYFDISDTRPNRNARAVPIWKMRSEYHEAVIETLENTYGELPDKSSLEMAILFASEQAATDHIQDYSEDLISLYKSRGMVDIDEGAIQKELRQMVSNSIAYMLMVRLGIDASNYITPHNLRWLVDYNSRATMQILGSAVSDIAEIGLGEIAKTVQSLEKEQRENHTFGKSEVKEYTGDTKTQPIGLETEEIPVTETEKVPIIETEEVKVSNENQTKERSSEDGDYIHNAGGLSATQSDLTQAEGSEAWEVWNATQEIPTGTQKVDVLLSVDRMHPEPTPTRSGEGSPTATGTSGRADEERTEHHRRVESDEYDELGTEDEQHSQHGTGDSFEGTDLQLEWHDRKKEDKSLPFFGSDKDINAILLTTPHLKVERDDIRRFFESNVEKEARKDYIRSIFNHDFTEITIGEEQKCVGYKTYENVLHLWEGSYLNKAKQSYYDWGVIAEHFDSLRLLGELYDTFKPLPSVGGQMSLFDMDTKKDSKSNQFIFSQEIIDTVITGGSNFSESKFRIYHQFQQSSSGENIEFLKREYGTGGRTTIQRGLGIGESHDAKGITLNRGYGEGAPKILLKWSVVEKRIRELIKLERFMSLDELEHYPFWLEDKEISRLANEEVPTKVEEQLSEANLAKLLAVEERAKIVPEETNEVSEEPKEEILGEVPEETIEDAKLAPVFEFTKTPAIKDFTLLPSIPESSRNQYTISNDNLGIGTLKEKYQRNVAAIRLLQVLNREERPATPAEQEIVVQYVGWGGLSDAFDGSKYNWSNEFRELKALLSDEDYDKARESTLTAFYTPPVVIRSIYNALDKFGFQTGNILEPSVGTGNFIGMLPTKMQESKVYGVELDNITGQIARQLYQKSTIAIQGFEESNLPDSFFDVAIGNVPFGDFKVVDKRYDRHNFLIHDYFFGKTLDKVRPGGIIAFITSKGTMDKENPRVRKYIASRADLIGAIRLPYNTFRDNAGTEVTSDIIFLQKRDRIVDIESDWVYLDTTQDGITMNRYFVEHPWMILGEMKMVSGRFGPESTCIPFEGHSLEIQLAEAITNLQALILEYENVNEIDESGIEYIPADPDVRNFSYCLVDGSIYFRENSLMSKIEVSQTAKSRIKGMIDIRDCTRKLIEYQTEDYSDEDITEVQGELNRLYDNFTKKYGIISSRANNSAFSMDSSYSLLGALEILDENQELERKADLFFKRTIKPKQQITSVDTAAEALSVSMAEKAKVDMPYMERLTGKTGEELFLELNEVIFANHDSMYNGSTYIYETSDEYLSGNVREKLKQVEWMLKQEPVEKEILQINYEALKRVQPKDLSASEISVRLGATWLPKEDVEEFMYHIFSTPPYQRWNIKVQYSEFTGEWSVSGKSNDKANVKVNNTYGTKRVNGYKIFEETLNLKDVRVYDYYEEDGKKKSELNRKETAIAQGKQELIKEAFKN